MHDLLKFIAEMRRQATAIKAIIVTLPAEESAKLRQALYDLEAAIYVMERAAADAYRAA